MRTPAQLAADERYEKKRKESMTSIRVEVVTRNLIKCYAEKHNKTINEALKSVFEGLKN